MVCKEGDLVAEEAVAHVKGLLCVPFRCAHMINLPVLGLDRVLGRLSFDEWLVRVPGSGQA